MGGVVQRTVKRWLRIPSDPRPPAGSAASVRIFHPAVGYLRYAQVRWVLRQFGILIGFLFAFGLGGAFFGWFSLESRVVTEVVERLPGWLVAFAERFRLIDIENLPDTPATTRVSFGPGMVVVELIGLAIYLLQIPLSYAMVRLDYELRFYIVTDRSLRIREGITAIRESTMTFDNIQNISIRQGPVQRAFGISDLRVRTAGGGSGGGDEESEQDGADAKSMHIGYFRGVDNAEELRDTIFTRLRSLKDAGVADAQDTEPRSLPTALVAARQVLEETRALRTALR